MSEPILLGTVTDYAGEQIRIIRRADGIVALNGEYGTWLGFTPDALTDLRDLLDRAAMPGQHGATEMEAG